jgi:hypothetical protein
VQYFAAGWVSSCADTASMVDLLHIDDTPGALPGGLDSGDLSKAALLAYMRGCPVVLSARTRRPDRFDPAGVPIPLGWYSDGVFAWTAETIAYIDRYDFGVPAHFVEHVARTGTAPTVLTDDQRESALDSIRGTASTRGISQRLADWLLSVALEYDSDRAGTMGDAEIYPWLYDELSMAIVSGALDGAELLNCTGQQMGKEGDDSDLRMLWGDVFPDRPFPQR